MKIEFSEPVRRLLEPILHVSVDDERVGYIVKYPYLPGYRVEWNIPIASNWPPSQATQIILAVSDKITALNVAARLRK